MHTGVVVDGFSGDRFPQAFTVELHRYRRDIDLTALTLRVLFVAMLTSGHPVRHELMPRPREDLSGRYHLCLRHFGNWRLEKEKRSNIDSRETSMKFKIHASSPRCVFPPPRAVVHPRVRGGGEEKCAAFLHTHQGCASFEDGIRWLRKASLSLFLARR